jgi:hypothetical protein
MADLDFTAPAPQAHLAGSVLDLAISPAGKVYLETAQGDIDVPASTVAARIAKAFGRGGAHGLLQRPDP